MEIDNIYTDLNYCHDNNLYFLNLFSNYDDSESDEKLQFFFEDAKNKELIRISQTLGLKKIVGFGDELQKLSRLKQYANDILSFDGKFLRSREFEYLNSLEIIDSAKKLGFSLNCRYKSFIFTQMLLSLGYKARWVRCLSFDLRTSDAHCVTEVYIEGLKKWIVADCAFNTFYFSSDGTLLNLMEMRECLSSGKPIRFLTINKKNIDYIKKYWTQNIFRFTYLSNLSSKSIKDKNYTYYALNPMAYRLKDISYSTKNGFEKVLNYYNIKKFY